jgi:hypothetical protein
LFSGPDPEYYCTTEEGTKTPKTEMLKREGDLRRGKGDPENRTKY